MIYCHHSAALRTPQIDKALRFNHVPQLTGRTMGRNLMIFTLVLVGLFQTCLTDDNITVEYPRHDGWYNNRAHPNWGTPGSHLLRKVPAAYSDGSYKESGKGWPNPRLISEKTMKGPSGLPSYMNRTVFLGLFGQFVSLESLKASGAGCPRELTPIKIPKCDAQYDPKCTGTKKTPFLRAKYDPKTGHSPGMPREQTNGVSSFIDGSVIYSNSLPWQNAMRTRKNGTLKSLTGDGLWPALNTPSVPMLNLPPAREHELMEPERHWLLGDPRLFQHPGMLAFGVLFMRYHNSIAQNLAAKYPDWTDQRIFKTARKWVVATQQKIYAYDFYPAFTNTNLPPYSGYKDYIEPSVSHIFQSAAFRFGHSIVPPGFYRRDKMCNYYNTTSKTVFPGYSAVRMCNVWFHGDEAFEYGLEPVIMGMTSQITEREDHILVDDVRGWVFGPLQHSRRDLATLNIQRGRDNGLPDYNTARKAMGLEPVTNWTQINPWLAQQDPAALDNLRDAYNGSLDTLDIFVAGMYESTPSGPGPLFHAVIEDHFVRLRDGDRFWFENKLNGLFTDAEIEQIKNTTLYDIIIQVTDINPGEIQENVFFWHNGDPCPQPKQLEISDMASCNDNMGYDFFTGSDVVFIILMCIIGLWPIFCICLVLLLACIKKRQSMSKATSGKNKVGVVLEESVETGNQVVAVEWRGSESSRHVCIVLDKGQFIIEDLKGNRLRTVDVQSMGKVITKISTDDGGKTICCHFPKEYDCVLQFSEKAKREKLSKLITIFANDFSIKEEAEHVTSKEIYATAETKERRKVKVEKFLHHVFEQSRVAPPTKADSISDLSALAEDKTKKKPTKKTDTADLKHIFDLEMSREEFAEAMVLKPDSMFVDQMFSVVDKDGNGYISFREFMDVLVLLSNGTEDDKMRLMFDMYDLDGGGTMDRNEFTELLKSMIEMADSSLSSDEIDVMLHSMFSSAGFEDKEELTFEDFKMILSQDKTDEFGNKIKAVDLSGGQLKSDMAKKEAASRPVSGVSRPRTAGEKLNVETTQAAPPEKASQNALQRFLKFMENNRLNVVYLAMFFLITIAVFIERSVFYSTLNEAKGLRRIAGYGVSITRGAASSMSFTFSVILLTMCKNTMNMLKTTWVANYVPFDSALGFHKISAWTSIIIALAHTVGHCFNFYHVSTQPPDFVGCVFSNTIWFRSDYLPTFAFWVFQTVTGFTGVLLVLLLTLMTVFATSWARSKVYSAFWTIHNLYILLYALLILHGSAVLVQDPWFYFFWLGPGLLFALDKLVSISTKSTPLTCIAAEHLPSNVTHIKLKKPPTFKNHSGQWARIAIAGHNENEYHPFTITAAEHEDFISFHIRALGPWTSRLRQLFDPNNLIEQPYPKVYIDGPFGGVSEDWPKYEVNIMIGGGIGITPYAAILKHVAYLNSIKAKMKCKKIYFFWVTKNQRQFEWMIDILREVEEADETDMVTVQLFVTQFFGKFDLRTVIMFLCEKHFVNISERSLFTGLKAPTNFGRPNFEAALMDISKQWPKVKKFGVFSTGPLPLTKSVAKAVSDVNKKSTSSFHHYEENF